MDHGSRADEAERYRIAAEDTLRQVEWCVAYLRRLGKEQLAGTIDRNRKSIQDRLNP